MYTKANYPFPAAPVARRKRSPVACGRTCSPATEFRNPTGILFVVRCSGADAAPPGSFPRWSLNHFPGSALPEGEYRGGGALIAPPSVQTRKKSQARLQRRGAFSAQTWRVSLLVWHFAFCSGAVFGIPASVGQGCVMPCSCTPSFVHPPPPPRSLQVPPRGDPVRQIPGGGRGGGGGRSRYLRNFAILAIPEICEFLRNLRNFAPAIVLPAIPCSCMCLFS